MITSKENSKFKFIKSLQTGHNRKKSNSFIIEGFKLIREALDVDISLESIFYSPLAFQAPREEQKFLNDILSKDITSYYISDNLMKELSETVTPRGLLAVVKKNFSDPVNVDFGKDFWVFSCDIQDPGNLGTIIRTADASGAKGIFLSPDTVDVTSPKVIRSTMGSFFHLKLYKLKDMEEFIINSKKEGVTFISTDVREGRNYIEINYNFPLVLIAGNEGQGIGPEILSLSDFCVNIPIYGKAESLNVGVAAGIILYEIGRQKFVREQI